MQPVDTVDIEPLAITIEGDFWDCQIYRGRLYLWYSDDSIGVYEWDRLIEEVFARDGEKLALICAFTRGDYLYNKSNLDLLFQDKEIKEVLFNKFIRLSQQNLHVDSQILEKYKISQQENPAKELPTDTCIYDNRLFTLTDVGLYRSSVHKPTTKYAVSTRPNKLWDCPLLSVKANKGVLAMSGGNEGVFQFHIDEEKQNISNLEPIEKGIYRLSNLHSSLINWSFSSLYSSSYVDSGFLIGFESNYNEGKGKYERSLCEIVSELEIFHSKGFSWGSQEKMYLANSGEIKVISFTQSHLNSSKQSAFKNLASIEIDNHQGDIISASVALFGIIIEHENAITVMRSDNHVFSFCEDIVRWRIYPRSKRYENHLHVIYEDRLVVYSFNHDYFVNQTSKIKGFKYDYPKFNHNRKYFKEKKLSSYTPDISTSFIEDTDVPF